ncbi:YigZ family protein [Flavobacteriales bacterium]|nr:YigZ family protein [Flavobacteriales bacterium]
MSQTFQTISTVTESLFKDRGSKFVGYAFPVSSVDEVKSKLNYVKSLHPTSRHVCFAYQLGIDGSLYRANDDGEPNGSAGLPILNQIRSKEVTDTLVAVVRYFGGTKLGVSGLINAYKKVAKDALDQSEVVTHIPMATVSIQFPHSSIGGVERLIRQYGWGIKNQEFGMECKWDIETPVEEEMAAKEAFGLLLG